MATPQEPAETQPPYPSYETLRAAQKWIRLAPNSGQLLFWTLNAPLKQAISVMASPSSPGGPLEPYYNQDDDSWHPISRLSITQPKISAVTVRVYQLDEWDAGENEDQDDDEDEKIWVGKEEFGVTVKPTAAGDEAFVTVHDFLEVVHPWLMKLRKEILNAKGMLEGNDQPLADDTELMVDANGLECLIIEEKEEWIAHKKKPPVRSINISVA